jgi:hypothetical protein
MRTNTDTAVRALAWFSLALGATEIICARPLARQLRMRGSENVLRAYGLREIATGVGLLTARDPRPWMWGRVAGDALDIATLAMRLQGKLGRNTPVVVALASVAGATVADAMTVRALQDESSQASREYQDYSARSGFPMGLSSARGVAREAASPPDYRMPEAMRPASR